MKRKIKKLTMGPSDATRVVWAIIEYQVVGCGTKVAGGGCGGCGAVAAILLTCVVVVVVVDFVVAVVGGVVLRMCWQSPAVTYV